MIAALCAILFLAALIFGLAYANRPRPTRKTRH